jgi:hypothetical protein
MTYPQYGPPPQQGYAQQASQYAPPPQYAPPAPAQQYGPPPQAAAPQAAAPQTFQSPAALAPAGAPRPKAADLVGRLVLFTPQRIDLAVPNQNGGPPQDRITADFVVLDGGPLAFGGSSQTGRPNSHQDQTMPVKYLGGFFSQTLIVQQLRPYLPAQGAQPGNCLGRLVRGQSSQPGRNAPWRLDDPTEEDKALATWYLGEAAAGRLPHPSTAVAPAQPGPQYTPALHGQGYVQQLPQGYPSQGQPQYAPQGPGQQPQGPPPGYPMAPPPPPAPGQYPQYAPQQPGPAGYLANPDPGAQYQPQQAPPAATPWG